jgi:hypothetical protein
VSVEIRTIRDGPRLVPATQYDLELLENIGQRGKPLRTRITLDRSSKLHRWYWTFIGVVAEGIDMPVKALHVMLKTKAGLIDGIIAGENGAQLIIQSTSHDVMGDDEFRPYVDKAKNIVFRDYLAPDTAPEVYRRVELLLEERRR